MSTPLKAIRAKCLDCSAGSTKEVRECPVKACPLWPYRMGCRPATYAKRQAKRQALCDDGSFVVETSGQEEELPQLEVCEHGEPPAECEACMQLSDHLFDCSQEARHFPR